MEHPGAVVLEQDQPLPSIEEELVPMGEPKILRLAMPTSSGVAAAPIVHANMDKLDDYEIDNDDGIIAVGDIPQ